VGGVVAVGVLLGLAACGGDDATREYVGYRQSPGQQVGAVSLPDASAGGADFTFAAEPGHLLIAYFGYTSCPDVCPTTLSGLRQALRDLGDDAARVDLAMVTIDPARDTDDVLTGYVQSFVDGAHALRTDDDTALRAAADAFGASYLVTTAADGKVEVAHSGAMYVVDPSGTVTLTWPFGVSSDDIRGDLAQLFDEYAA
jgi:protein SCO1/2